MSESGVSLGIPAARLTWQGDQPSSVEFGDIYHAGDGVAEVERVFLAPTHFDQRAAAATGEMTVAEVGFGTGLNFVTAAHRFLGVARRDATLHFVSFEARPIHPEQFAALAQRRGRSQSLYRELAHAYPPLLPGWHRLHLAGGRIVLSIFFGTAQAGLADLAGRLRAPVS
ncbi:MAG: amino acid oxidase, partial [Rhodobacteraceae bacterium]|nr:amino acid oxidase [Paracoccaceae bacterium]